MGNYLFEDADGAGSQESALTMFDPAEMGEAVWFQYCKG